MPGVLGSRMTGGGFGESPSSCQPALLRLLYKPDARSRPSLSRCLGGCTVTLVQKSAVEALDRAIKAAYRAKYNVEATTFFTVPGQGAGTVDLHAREEPQRSTLMIISLSKTKGSAPLTRLALSEGGMSNGRSLLAALGVTLQVSSWSPLSLRGR